MAKNIVVHSFRRDTGKTNLTAWLAALCASAGQRVGVVEVEISLPGLRTHFHLTAADTAATINDYLLGRRLLQDCAVEVSALMVHSRPLRTDRIMFIPASTEPSDISDTLRVPVDVTKLGEGFAAFTAKYDLDLLFVCAPAGLDEISLSCIALADILVVVLRLEKEETHGSGVILDLAHQLNVPEVLLVVNRVPEEYDRDDVKREVEAVYGHEVPVVLTATDEAELMFAGRATAFDEPASLLSPLVREIKAKT